MNALPLLVSLAIALAPGCSYPATFSDCSVSCAADGACPTGLTCSTGGRCRIEGAVGSCPVPSHDAPGLVDGDASCICTNNKLLTCASGSKACPLGCVADPNGGHCKDLQPSNGATDQHLIGVTAGLVVPPGAIARIDSDWGEIKIGDTVARPAGPGVIAGIGFYPLTDTIAVFAATHVAVGANAVLRGRGDRALILWSGNDIQVAGVIQVSAGCEADNKTFCPGPGGTAGSTTSATSIGCGAGSDGDTAANGGGGGGLGAPGGTSATCTEGPSGPACGSPALVPLIGGFGGGSSGSLYGGGGGGGIQLSAKIAITFTAGPSKVGIHAGGGGGEGRTQTGPYTTAGGGGGSGGGILLEAPDITFTANTVLAANGGGGGDTSTQTPFDGETGRFDAMPAAAGGTSSGTGGALDASAKAGCVSGSGGGVGRIRLNSLPNGIHGTDAIISPAAGLGSLPGS